MFGKRFADIRTLAAKYPDRAARDAATLVEEMEAARGAREAAKPNLNSKMGIARIRG